MDYLYLEVEDSRDNKFFNSCIIGGLSIIFFFLFLPLNTYSQRKSDIGVFAGTSYYMGDINPSKHFYSPGLAIGPIYRYNFELRNSIRISAVYHTLKASDNDFNDPFQQLRDASFKASFIDAAAAYEFNFSPYKTTNRKYNQTFYLSAGIGYHIVISSNPYSPSHVTVPFGIGYKLNINKKFAAGIEFSERKVFTDLMDGVENFTMEGNKHLFGNNDWYTFAGIFFTYKIFNFREDCPAYDKKKWQQ